MTEFKLSAYSYPTYGAIKDHDKHNISSIKLPFIYCTLRLGWVVSFHIHGQKTLTSKTEVKSVYLSYSEGMWSPRNHPSKQALLVSQILPWKEIQCSHVNDSSIYMLTKVITESDLLGDCTNWLQWKKSCIYSKVLTNPYLAWQPLTQKPNEDLTSPFQIVSSKTWQQLHCKNCNTTGNYISGCRLKFFTLLVTKMYSFLNI